MRKGKVNYKASYRWLEPYIDWEFEIIKVTGRFVTFLMDHGFGNMQPHRIERECFDIPNLTITTNTK